jgi:hypothetical protein
VSVTLAKDGTVKLIYGKLRFKQTDVVVKDLASKLDVLGTIFKLFHRAAKRVRERQFISSDDDDMAHEAASIIHENIDACWRTLNRLLGKQPQELKAKHAGSFLRGAVKYLVYDIQARESIENRLKEIDDRIKSMEIALHFIETWVFLEAVEHKTCRILY